MRQKLPVLTSLVALGLPLILACGDILPGSTPLVSGQVSDYAGNPLSGVEIRVRNSAYRTSSNEQGEYSIEFAPGAFQVDFVREGFTSETLELNVQGSVEFPADVVKLYPIPPDESFAVLGSSGLTLVPEGPIERQTVNGSWYSSSYKLFCTSESPVSVPSGSVRFIDTTTATYVVAKLGGYGLIFSKGVSEDDGGDYNGLMKDSKSKYGAEGLLVRSMELEPGNYAWIPIGKSKDGERDIDDDGNCLPFVVR